MNVSADIVFILFLVRNKLSSRLSSEKARGSIVSIEQLNSFKFLTSGITSFYSLGKMEGKDFGPKHMFKSDYPYISDLV